MMRCSLPGGLKLVFTPYGEEPEVWMSVLAYDSLSYISTSMLYLVCCSAAEIADNPMSAPPPSPQTAMTLIGSLSILPLRINARSPAAVPVAAEPAEPSCVCIQGSTQGVV